MPSHFTLSQRLAGFAGSAAKEGDLVKLVYRELVAPTDGEHLLDRLEGMQKALFSFIPGLPSPSRIDHLLVVINDDLSAVAYVNELNITAQITPNREIKSGEAIFLQDIEDISSIDLGVDIPDDSAVVLVRSNSWRRSLFFDYGPILDKPIPRDYPIEKALAQQALLLLGVSNGRPENPNKRLSEMKAGLRRLEQLLEKQSRVESEFQQLLQDHPWMFGGTYDLVLRHANLDDARIPDFTARRAHDLSHDVIEIKQPFLELFRGDGGFRAEFNDAWNQCEEYLSFCQRQAAYLRDEKDLHFENPRCLLLLGFGLTENQRRAIRRKEAVTPTISVRTYEEMLRVARHLVALMETSGDALNLREG